MAHKKLRLNTVDVDMDPRLQRLVMHRQYGRSKLASSSTGENEVAVVAKVSDLDAWNGLSEVHVGQTVGPADGDGTWIVTGRIPVRRIEAVRARPFVKSLKAAHRVRSTLVKTTEETGCTPALLPAGTQSGGGAGVLVGIVDFGGDFAHRNFADPQDRTRLVALWDQNGIAGGSPLGYGSVYDQAAINAALSTPNPYVTLGYGPSPGEAAHGTHVMDIAAGNGRGSTVPGMAPEAKLAFVELASSDVPWQGSEVVGRSFGDSVQLLEAVKWIFDLAGGGPCVVNLSLGTNGGPHDGSTLVEQGFDRLVRQAPNRAIVIAASNSHDDGVHAQGAVPAVDSYDLKWSVQANDRSENELELWYPGGTSLSVEIIAPGGESLGSVGPGENGTIVDDDGKPIVFVGNRLNDSNNGDNQVGVWLAKGAPTGTWTLHLVNADGADVPFHAWVERDDAGQSSFLPPHHNSYTLGSISCGHETLVVGSYDAHKPGQPVSWFSSEGPTRDGREKPEISAPGHDVMAARSRSSTGVARKSGTSMAAPAVTGLVALVLAEAAAKGVSLDIGQIRNAVLSTARQAPPPAGGWDPRYGVGRISGQALTKV